MTEINLEQLAKEIRNLHRRQRLYQVLRDELSKLGFWRVKPRGNPSAGYKAMKEKMKGE